MLSPMNYLRAAVSFRAGLQPNTTIPRIERSLPPAVMQEQQLETLRRLCHYPSDGYVPLTYPYIYALPLHLSNMLDSRFPLPIIGTVHIRSHIRQIRPIGSGEQVRTVCWIEGHRETEKGIEFDLFTHIYAGAELVWQGTATMLRRFRRQANEAALPSAAVRPSLDGVGATSEVWRLPKGLSRQFAFASGDLNPIHVSALAARLFGFSGAIMHGSWAEMRLAGTQPELCRQPHVELRCDFKQPIQLPATVIFRQWPQRGNSGRVELRLLNSSATKPHAIGIFGPQETNS